ncbi:hypothetical protein, partial [Gibbsiella quercinecans]|uniref:hypothetical protein n=1 Tax=Gibbsiella quercinecans TaxID=929813 RepID=UPI0024301A86
YLSRLGYSARIYLGMYLCIWAYPNNQQSAKTTTNPVDAWSARGKMFTKITLPNTYLQLPSITQQRSMHHEYVQEAIR